MPEIIDDSKRAGHLSRDHDLSDGEDPDDYALERCLNEQHVRSVRTPSLAASVALPGDMLRFATLNVGQGLQRKFLTSWHGHRSTSSCFAGDWDVPAAAVTPKSLRLLDGTRSS